MVQSLASAGAPEVAWEHRDDETDGGTDIEADHRRAQRTGAVFAGVPYDSR